MKALDTKLMMMLFGQLQLFKIFGLFNQVNIWAIQSGTSNSSDEVEHRDETPHCSLADKGIDIQQFVDKWDAAHLLNLQTLWDENSDVDESVKGPRPTSYSS
jgi:hypothetical protein